jgi:hypothetical protein
MKALTPLIINTKNDRFIRLSFQLLIGYFNRPTSDWSNFNLLFEFVIIFYLQPVFDKWVLQVVGS